MTIPALPDAERLTSYAIVSPTTGPLAVGFQIYADGSDYANWLEVWDDGVKLTAVTDYTVSSAGGGPDLSIIARPITDARVTFISARSGVIRIVGARRPRQISQFTNGTSISADQHNRRYTDLMATLREVWDLRTRMFLAPPGETGGVIGDGDDPVVGGDLSDPILWGAIGDGDSHPLSSRFVTLAEAQAVYPAAVALTDEIDWAAIQKMCDAHQTIKLGSRRYVLNRQLTYSSASFAMTGDGLDKSWLTWLSNSASFGISITHDGPQQNVHIAALALISAQVTSSVPPTGTALLINNTVDTSPSGDQWASYTRITLRDLVMRGTAYASTGWLHHVDTFKPIYLSANNVSFSGGSGAGANQRVALTNGSLTAFRFRSDGTGVTCCARIDNCQATWIDKAIVSDTNFESLEVTKFDAVNVNYGADIVGTTTPSQFNFRDCHINALVRGFRFNNVGFAVVENCLIFEMSLADQAVVGIEMISAVKPIIRGNSFYKAGAQTFTNISLGAGTTMASVFDNKLSGDIGILVNSAAVTGVISDNDQTEATAMFSGDPSGMLVRTKIGKKQFWNAGGVPIISSEDFGFNGQVVINGGASTPLLMNRTGDGNVITFYKSFAALWIADISGNGVIIGRSADYTGFYGATPIQKPAVTGIRRGGPALASMLTALSNLGLLTDSSTADGAWTTYTPTITPASGTFTSATASGRYKQLDKTVHIQISLVVTTVGTATPNVTLSLPALGNAAANAAMVGTDMQNLTTAAPVLGTITSGAANVSVSLTLVNAHTYVLSGTYEVV